MLLNVYEGFFFDANESLKFNDDEIQDYTGIQVEYKYVCSPDVLPS